MKSFNSILFISIFLFSNTLFALKSIDYFETQDENKRLENYLNLLETFEGSLGPHGDYTQGEVEVVTDATKIKQIEETHKQKLISSGIDEKIANDWSRVGIIQSDSMWVWIRDAVILPSGRTTIRDRLGWKSSIDGPQGVSMLPILKDKRIVVCLKYKHPLRSWQIEQPRGFRFHGEKIIDASNRQLRKKTGLVADSQLYIGSIAPDSSNFNTLVPVFIGYVNETVEPTKYLDDDVMGFLVLTKEEIKEAFVRGYIELKIKGHLKKVGVNDAYLSYSILQAECRGLI